MYLSSVLKSTMRLWALFHFYEIMPVTQVLSASIWNCFGRQLFDKLNTLTPSEIESGYCFCIVTVDWFSKILCLSILYLSGKCHFWLIDQFYDKNRRRCYKLNLIMSLSAISCLNFQLSPMLSNSNFDRCVRWISRQVTPKFVITEKWLWFYYDQA